MKRKAQIFLISSENFEILVPLKAMRAERSPQNVHLNGHYGLKVALWRQLLAELVALVKKVHVSLKLYMLSVKSIFFFEIVQIALFAILKFDKVGRLPDAFTDSRSPFG